MGTLQNRCIKCGVPRDYYDKEPTKSCREHDVGCPCIKGESCSHRFEIVFVPFLSDCR